MVRRSIRAFAAILAGLVTSLSAPGLALAHGHAHHELVEHSVQTQRTPPAIDGAATGGEDARHDGHGHPSIDPGLFSRLVQLSPALVAPNVTLVDCAIVLTDALAVSPVPFESPPAWCSTRPEQPRAPPVL